MQSNCNTLKRLTSPLESLQSDTQTNSNEGNMAAMHTSDPGGGVWRLYHLSINFRCISLKFANLFNSFLGFRVITEAERMVSFYLLFF